MQLNAQLFQAASTIYHTLLSADTNRMPHAPEHANRAASLASKLYEAANKNGVTTNCAARILCGFMVNSQSAHCSDDELVAWATQGVHLLVNAFQGGAIAAPMPQPVYATGTQPQMPPPAVPPPPAAPPVFAPPAVPMQVPDFTDGGQ